MALYKIGESEHGVLPFPLWDGVTHSAYCQYLVTPPRIYTIEVSRIEGFFYIPPPEDVYLLWLWCNYAYWPSWKFEILKFNAADGSFKEGTMQSGISGSFWGCYYTNNVEIGPDGLLYATRNDTTKIYRETYDAQRFDSWELAPQTWTPSTIFQTIIVNLLDDYCVGTSSLTTSIFKNISTTPERIFYITNPDLTVDLAYESRECCWMLGSSDWLTKLNYQQCRVEMLSKLPTVTAVEKAIAYDTFRKQICVFNRGAPATDGADTSFFEWFLPTPKMYGVTSPVPITPIKSGEKTTFVSQVYGESGEAISGSTLKASLVAPNNNGTILTPTVGTDIGGTGRILYKAPETAVTDVMQVSLEVPDNLTDL